MKEERTREKRLLLLLEGGRKKCARIKLHLIVFIIDKR